MSTRCSIFYPDGTAWHIWWDVNEPKVVISPDSDAGELTLNLENPKDLEQVKMLRAGLSRALDYWGQDDAQMEQTRGDGK